MAPARSGPRSGIDTLEASVIYREAVQRAASSRGVPLMEMAHIEFHVTPFRAERFAALYRPIVPRVMAFGAAGYMFYRSEEDSDHFIHASLWEDRTGFQRFWLSREMQDVRAKVSGLHEQPVLPTWATLLDRG
jgi:quinol monooxygenase YgiN